MLKPHLSLLLFVKMFERFVGSCVDRSKLRLNWKPTDCNSLNDKDSRYFWLRNDSSFAVIDFESNNKLIEHHFHSNNESSSKIICIESCFLQIDHSKPSTSFDGNDQNFLSENDRVVASNDIDEKFGLYVVVRHKATSKKQEVYILHCFNLEFGYIVSSLELDFEPTNILVLKDARFSRGNLQICRSLDDFHHIVLIGSNFGKLILCNPDWSSSRAHEQENVLEPFEMENLVDLSPDWDPKIAFRIDILNVAISSLFLLNTANFIIVGFNIGTFMIMSTLNFQPLFLSEYGSLKMPVRKFEYQEPENDPRATLYLWVVRQSSSRVHVELHQMCFSDKSSEHSYKKFESCFSRFNFPVDNCAKVLSVQTLELQSGNDVTLSDDRSTDRNLFYITWLSGDSSVDETGRYFTKSSANKRLKGALFDLNGWYYAQMPRRFDLHGERQFSAPKNRRQVDFLIVHDYGCLQCLDECCLAVKTLPDCIERCHYDSAAVYASSIGFQSILVTDDKFYDLQICNLKRQALNYILYNEKIFTEDSWLQINEILNNGTINDVQYPEEFSFHLVKEQICDSLFNDRNFDVLIRLVSILTSADSNNDIFGQWLWRKSIDLKTEFDEYCKLKI
uniref:ELYS beta-propeller domain-containing protein n=1 Tax=Romanomermis culicivorax TaxID=13658 RepID=A0A915JNW1_ROMCU